MAATGLVLFGFVVVHMLGNLQIFLGPEALNGYAEKLESLGEWLWIARGVLLAALVVHVLTAISLTRENEAARPVKYARKEPVASSYASRTMAMSGVIVFLFIVYHLLHFTFGVTNPDLSHRIDAQGRHDVYSMVIMSFRQTAIAAVYVVAMFPLALHLSHGFQSLFQSLGVNHPKYTPAIRTASGLLALAVFAGNCSIAAACYFGALKLPGGA